MFEQQWDLPPDACIEKISSKVMLHMQKNIVVYGYNAASHSLGVALHSGSGWLCRDPFFDIPKPLFVLKELICLTTCGILGIFQRNTDVNNYGYPWILYSRSSTVLKIL